MKNKSLTFKLSEEEKKKIIQEAQNQSLTTASFCRFIILQKINEVEHARATTN